MLTKNKFLKYGLVPSELCGQPVSGTATAAGSTCQGDSGGPLLVRVRQNPAHHLTQPSRLKGQHHEISEIFYGL